MAATGFRHRRGCFPSRRTGEGVTTGRRGAGSLAKVQALPPVPPLPWRRVRTRIRRVRTRIRRVRTRIRRVRTRPVPLATLVVRRTHDHSRRNGGCRSHRDRLRAALRRVTRAATRRRSSALDERSRNLDQRRLVGRLIGIEFHNH